MGREFRRTSGRVAFMIGVAALCMPSAVAIAGPGADSCSEAVPLPDGEGPFSFNNQFATQDGPPSIVCNIFNNDQIDLDVWFAWFSPSEVCVNGYVVETCGLTNVDTKIAVYDGPTCPPGTPLACSDDDCGTQGFQTRAVFLAQPDSVYLIRIGTFPGVPGGPGQFRVKCAAAPTNDDCADAVPISGEGQFAFDTLTATADGPVHADCSDGRQPRTDNDVWYCWTSECTERVFVTTCGLTLVDTKMVVYDGCDCPASETRLVACSDDNCVLGTSSAVQSNLGFNAVQGHSYLIRMGTYDGELGGTGAMNVTCGTSACPSAGSCFTGRSTRGCSDEECCEKVCALDAFCCNGQWDSTCAARASGLCTASYASCNPTAGSCMGPGRTTPGCNDNTCCNTVCDVDPVCCISSWDSFCVAEAEGLCTDGFDGCGAPSSGSCENPFPTGLLGCDDEACCNQVCAVDPYCCIEGWDQICSLRAAETCHLACESATGDCHAAGDSPGCGDGECCASVCADDPFCCMFDWDAICVERAALVCPGNCPPGEVSFVNPADGVVYAGFANDPFSGAEVGIKTFDVAGPAGADPSCFTLCETAENGSPNSIVEVTEFSVAGTGSFYLITLARPITPNAVTTITYSANDSSSTTGEFISHMGNVDPVDGATAADVAALIDCCLRGICTPAWGEYSCDVDRSGAVTAADIMAVIDSLNGGGPLNPTLGTSVPSAAGVCPAQP